ncbi:MAG: NAD(P)H-dependent oxidoreductase, partial [bacterium]|nr:NAD(P)H-dependent oxidoreductase [bacterium]
MSEQNLDLFIKQLEWRYATKKFDPSKKVPAKIIEKIMQAARLSPSSFGLQPWHFLVIENQEIRSQLRPHAWNQPQISDASSLVVLCTKTEMTKEYINSYADSIVKERGIKPSDIEPYRQMMLGSFPGMTGEAGKQWMAHQTYIALGMLMSACAMAEVDACPMEGFSKNDFDKILNLPEKGLNVRVLCTIGYRAS